MRKMEDMSKEGGEEERRDEKKEKEQKREKTVLRTKEIELYVGYPFLCFCFLQQYCPCIRPNRLTEAKFFDPSSTNIYCGSHFGLGPDQ